MENELLYELQHNFFGRERRERDVMICRLILGRKHRVHTELTDKLLVELAKDFESYSRLWRKIMQEHPELRGTDYYDKNKLAQEKQVSLGYAYGFNEDMKRLKEL